MTSLKSKIDVLTIRTTDTRPSEEFGMSNFAAAPSIPSSSADQQLKFSDRVRIMPYVGYRRLGCCFYIRLFAAGVSTFVGISIFFAFFFKYQNYHAAIAGCASGILAGGVFHLHLLNLQGKIEDWYSPGSLMGLQAFGLTLALVYTAAMSVYVYLAVSLKQDYTVDQSSYYPPATFSFLALKWAFGLFFEARHYKRSMERTNLALLSGIRVHPDSDSESLS